MKKNTCLLTLFLFFFQMVLFAQTNTQTLRGTLVDKDTHEAIIGATITVLQNEIDTTSDENGRFRIEDLAVGRYQLQVNMIGFETLVLSEVLLEAGKETILHIELQTAANDLQTIEVNAPSNSLNRNDTPVSIHTLTIEETRRFPANFNDPVRLAISLPGVVNENDQANGISIRGHSPNNMAWQLEGASIVNPNHLSNAGTFNDRPTANGGGVNILSAQLLGVSNFLRSALPVGYGNTLSGMMDMHLRTGNDEQHEFTTTVGLLGIDVAAEGPFSKNKKAAYIANYRYSTIGLLDALGVPLGDEAISFQDVAFNLNFPLKKGNLNVFGLGGLSKNTFEAQRDTSLWEFQKDNQDIRYTNMMGALGAKLKLRLSSNIAWHSTFVFSGLQSERQSDMLTDDLDIQKNYEQDELLQRRNAFSTYALYRWGTQNRLKLGINASQEYYEQMSWIQFSEVINNTTTDGILVQPFVNWQSRRGQWTSNIGVQYSHFTLNNTDAIEPRASLRWDFHPKQSLALGYGLHGQLQRPQVYTSTVADFYNQELGFTKAHHVVLGYTHQLNHTTRFSAEAYYHHLFDVPIVNQSNRTFSVLNIVDTWIDEPLENEGTGTNYGLEASLQRHITDGLYYLINATYYRSLYVGGDGIERPTRFDGKYIFNTTIGKEWTKSKNGKDKTWGVNARVTYLGGYRDTPIDVAASKMTGRTIYDETAAFSLTQKDYFKVDVRIYFRKNKGNRSSTIALDLQNATNQENVAYTYFDQRKGAVQTKNQLGLIPNLSYRLHF